VLRLHQGWVVFDTQRFQVRNGSEQLGELPNPTGVQSLVNDNMAEGSKSAIEDLAEKSQRSVRGTAEGVISKKDLNGFSVDLLIGA